MAKGGIEAEKRMVKQMIVLYCKGNHNRNNAPCADCRELIEYAELRLSRCPYGDEKSFCSKCPTHCYRTEMRARIKEVMRYSGPRMLIRYPGTVLRHFFCR